MADAFAVAAVGSGATALTAAQAKGIDTSAWLAGAGLGVWPATHLDSAGRWQGLSRVLTRLEQDAAFDPAGWQT